MKSLENGLPAVCFYSVCLIWVGPRRSQFAEICSVVDSSILENVPTQKLLGVYIDSTLSWKIHVELTCAKLSTKLHLLKRMKCFLTPEMQQTFYNS